MSIIWIRHEHLTWGHGLGDGSRQTKAAE